MLRNFSIIIIMTFTLSSCQISTIDNSKEEIVSETIIDEESFDYREAMRQWVITISSISKEKNADFIIIPQNCSPLFTDSGDVDGELSQEFIKSIDGVGQEGISFGYDSFDKATKIEDNDYITSLLNVGTKEGVKVLSINYTDTKRNIGKAIEHDGENGYISYVSFNIELRDIHEEVINENDKDISSLDDAENWLCMLNPEKYGDKEIYLNDLCKTNYDVIVIDSFFYEDTMLAKEDVSRLKIKENGARRLVISYLSIGEAENYRYYWEEDYYDNPPTWMLDENPKWEGNYPVKYWDEGWQRIIAADDNSYLNRIIDAGFDGVYLDIVDGYQTFEGMVE